jgi:NADPH2:quinone reductase
MRALLSIAAGGAESLVMGEMPDPEPGADEVRIAVRACAINYPDVLIIEDKYQFHPQRPFAPGVEISGVIDRLGADVGQLEVGQRVMASLSWGGLGELVNARARQTIPIPDSMPFDDAAALLVTYGTTYHALVDRAALRAGETMLVLGASGGVGIAAIELGKALGARVVAAVSAPEKAKVARGHGADETILYSPRVDDPKALAAAFKAACPAGAEVIYDAVGGAYAEPALRSIAWAGRYLVIGFAAGIPAPPLNLVLLKGCAIVGVFWGAWVERFPEQHRRNMAEVFALYETGAIKPHISERFSLERGGEAIRRLASREAVGKLIVTI